MSTELIKELPDEQVEVNIEGARFDRQDNPDGTTTVLITLKDGSKLSLTGPNPDNFEPNKGLSDNDVDTGLKDKK
jgi:hypothetical protein